MSILDEGTGAIHSMPRVTLPSFQGFENGDNKQRRS